MFLIPNRAKKAELYNVNYNFSNNDDDNLSFVSVVFDCPEVSYSLLDDFAISLHQLSYCSVYSLLLVPSSFKCRCYHESYLREI